MKPYYEHGGITIYHGDCRDVIPELPRVDLVLTDPPYGVDLESSPWDKSVPAPHEWLYPLFGRARTILITPGNGNQMIYPRPAWTLSWFRPGSVQRQRVGSGFSHWEPVLLYGENHFKVDCRQFAANNPDSGLGHPCPKPLTVFRWLIADAGPYEVVLDPFVGSGTTLKAAKELGKSAIGIDKYERYCEIAAKRLEQEVLPLEVSA